MQRGSTRAFVFLLAAATAAAVAAVAGCSSSSGGSKNSTSIHAENGSSGSGSIAVESSDDACTRVSQTDATRLFGRQASQLTRAPAPGSSTCVWGAHTDAGAADDVSSQLQVRIFPTASAYGESAIAGARHLTGLGDEAFIATQDSTAQLEYVKGGKTYVFKYTVVAADGRSPAASSLATKLETFVRASTAQS